MDNTGRIIDTIFSFYRCMREKPGEKTSFAQFTIVQLQTLVFLAKSKSASMSEIAQYLHIELPSTTTLIENLSKVNLVIKKQNKKDKRLMQVSLTVKGKRFLQKAKNERKKHMSLTLNILSEIEKKQLLKILEKLTKHMEVKHEK